MISTLHVYNFKGLKDLPLSRLKRFNLFVGMNNSGKSSLLEALYLVASGVSPYAIEAVLKFRGYTLLQRRDTDSLLEDNLEKFSSLYYGRTIHDFYKSPIIFKWDENELQCKVANYRFNLSPSEDGINTIPFVKEYDPTDADVAIGEHPVLIVKHNGKRTGIIDINRGRPFRRQDALYQCQLVRTSQISRNDNPDLFDRITMTPLEKHLISALQLIEPRITALNFLKSESSDSRIPYVVFKDSSTRYRLSSMGDGINRVLTIILALLNSENGFLLIDEFENGLHYTIQKKLWDIILMLSTKLNVQVFATTHSDDCIKGFIDSGAISDGQVIRLEIENEIIKPTLINNDRLIFAMNHSFDLR